MKDEGNITDWTWEENKLFENALVTYPEECIDRWERITSCLPGKTGVDVEEHYKKLVVDIENIESGEVALPNYPPLEEDSDVPTSEDGNRKKSKKTGSRRNSKPWTVEEHRRFLMGLEHYGKGAWQSISRNYVITRVASQVASHAQKYFTRLYSTNKDRRRSSIHDITTLDGQYYNMGPDSTDIGIMNYSDISIPQAPNSNESFEPTSLYGNSGYQSSQPPPAGPPPVGTHGNGIGHPIVVTLPNLGLPQHMAYGMQVAAPETALSSAVPDSTVHGATRNHTALSHTIFRSTSGQQSSQPPAGPPPVGTHGSGIGHPIVVIPPNLGLPQHMAYRMQVAAPEIALPGAVPDSTVPDSRVRSATNHSALSHPSSSHR